jgi:chromosomal replication initiator protein
VSGPLHAPAAVALGGYGRLAPNSGPLHDLHPRYVFETYIVGVSNRLAYAASQEVASTPGERYNPLFIYGGVGLGKTHLLHAIGHRARAEGRSVAYVTAERFTNEIIEAIRQRTTDEFRAKYRAVDVLLVDDVQFIAGKESTEEEFFHTFNTLHESSRQIVLSSDRVPHAMHLHDRLRSRFAWGLMADIQAPDFEQRLEILRAKAAGVAMPIPEEVLVCLARPECANIRSLEGALNGVIAHAQMLRQPLDARLVAQAMAPLEAERAQRPVESAEVLASVARHFGVSVEALSGKSREHGVAWARQVAMYLLREETPASLLQIGQQLGGRDHTTVMHGYNRVSKALLMDERVRGDIAAIRAALRG